MLTQAQQPYISQTIQVVLFAFHWITIFKKKIPLFSGKHKKYIYPDPPLYTYRVPDS